MCFINDLLAYSPDQEIHVELVREPLQRLKERKLYASVEMCWFHQSPCTHLGREVEARGVHVYPGETKALREWPASKSVQLARDAATRLAKKETLPILGALRTWRHHVASVEPVIVLTDHAKTPSFSRASSNQMARRTTHIQYLASGSTRWQQQDRRCPESTP